MFGCFSHTRLCTTSMLNVHRGQKGALEPLELAIVSYQKCMLKTELGSSAREELLSHLSSLLFLCPCFLSITSAPATMISQSKSFLLNCFLESFVTVIKVSNIAFYHLTHITLLIHEIISYSKYDKY